MKIVKKIDFIKSVRRAMFGVALKFVGKIAFVVTRWTFSKSPIRLRAKY